MIIRVILKRINKIILSDKNIVLSIFIGISILFGIYMHIIEKLTIIDTIYYLITTATTVGYGDISPKTDLGKIISIFYMVLSIGAVSVIIAETIEKIIYVLDKKKKGDIKMRKNPKLVIFGYPNEDKVKDIIEEIRLESEGPIVFVTNKIKESPAWFNENKVTFINGHVSKRSILDKANVSNAEIILIMAEDTNDISDDSVLAAALYIKDLKQKDTRIIIELNTVSDFHKEIFKCCTITTVTSAHVISQEILDEGAIELSQAIFQNNTDGTQFNLIYRGEDTTWEEIAIKLIQNSLIPEAYKNESFNFTPCPTDIIKKGMLIKYRGSKRAAEKLNL